MKRFHEELPLLERRARVAIRFASGVTGKWGRRKNGVPLGTFRKRKPYDCGQARCMLCHGAKLLRTGEAKNRTGRVEA